MPTVFEVTDFNDARLAELVDLPECCNSEGLSSVSTTVLECLTSTSLASSCSCCEEPACASEHFCAVALPVSADRCS